MATETPAPTETRKSTTWKLALQKLHVTEYVWGRPAIPEVIANDHLFQCSGTAAIHAYKFKIEDRLMVEAANDKDGVSPEDRKAASERYYAVISGQQSERQIYGPFWRWATLDESGESEELNA